MNTAVKYTLAGIAAVILGFISLGIIHPEIEYESRVQINAPIAKAFDHPLQKHLIFLQTLQ